MSGSTSRHSAPPMRARTACPGMRMAGKPSISPSMAVSVRGKARRSGSIRKSTRASVWATASVSPAISAARPTRSARPIRISGLPRLFFRQTIDLGGESETVDPDLNQLGGTPDGEPRGDHHRQIRRHRHIRREQVCPRPARGFPELDDPRPGNLRLRGGFLGRDLRRRGGVVPGTLGGQDRRLRPDQHAEQRVPQFPAVAAEPVRRRTGRAAHGYGTSPARSRLLSWVTFGNLGSYNDALATGCGDRADARHRRPCGTGRANMAWGSTWNSRSSPISACSRAPAGRRGASRRLISPMSTNRCRSVFRSPARAGGGRMTRWGWPASSIRFPMPRRNILPRAAWAASSVTDNCRRRARSRY